MDEIETDGRSPDVFRHRSDLFQVSSDFTRDSASCIDLEENSRACPPRLRSEEGVGPRILKDIGEFENVVPKARPHSPAARTSVQVKVVAIGRLSEGLLERGAAGFPDAVGPKYVRKSAKQSLREAEILDDDGIVAAPVNRFWINGQLSLGRRRDRFSGWPVVPKVLVNLGARRLIGISGIKLPPNLTFGVPRQTDDKEIGLMTAEKAQRAESLQCGEGQGPQVGTRSRASIDMGTVFRFYHCHPSSV
jgi:hypothetical protein